MTRFGKFSLVSLMVLTLGVALAGAIPAQAKMVVKISHIDPPDPFLSADQATAVIFKNMVESQSNGEIEVRVYAASQIGNERDSMAMLKDGTLEICIASAGGLATLYPMVGVLDTPFALPNMSVAWDVLDGWFGQKLKKSILDKTGVRCVEILDQGGFFHFTNNKRPITKIEDVQGIKFRSMTLPSHLAFFKAMGATAVPMPWSELYTALQTGVVDGQHNPFGPIMNAKLYEVQKYLSLSGHLWSTHWFLVNEAWYKSLTPDQQRIVRDAANVGKVAGRGITQIYEASDKGMPVIQKSLKINPITQAEKDRFAAVTIPAMTEYVKKELGDEGAAMQTDFLKAIKESREKLNY